MELNERNTLVVSIAVALTAITLIIGGVIGNTLASQATEREVKHDSDNLVRCVQTGKSSTDCRVLIYGAR